MKKIFVLFVLIVFAFSFSSKIAITEDLEKVVLHEDGTWELIEFNLDKLELNTPYVLGALTYTFREFTREGDLFIIDLEITNIGNEEMTMYFLEVSLIDENHRVHTPEMYVIGKPDPINCPTAPSLVPNRTRRGYLYFETDQKISSIQINQSIFVTFQTKSDYLYFDISHLK